MKRGQNVTIYPNVSIGKDCILFDGAVIGRPPMATKTMNRLIPKKIPGLKIGSSCIIGANSVLYTGSRLGDGVLIGDLASIREGCQIGEGSVIGRGAMLLYDCMIGNYVRIQDQVHIAGKTIIEDHTFIGMGVVTSNDNDVYLSRFGLAPLRHQKLVIRKYAFIGVNATLLPGIEIGRGAIVAAGAVVTKDVPAWTMVAGVPARHFKNIPNDWRRKVEKK